jgi:S1-C subfamily serine protease
MNKKLIFFFFLTLVISIFVNVVAGGWISAKVSSIPFFEKYHILDPKAPIVITRREEVKSGDSGDMLDAVNKAKSRLSSVATIAGSTITINGGAINLSADGYFLTTQQAIGGMTIPDNSRSIILNSGQQAPITSAYGESGTNLVIVKADLNNVSTTEFGSSKAMAAAQKIGFVHNIGTTLGAVYFQGSFVTSGQNNTAGRIFNTDKPSRSFGAQAIGSLLPGESVINPDGKVVGIWDGSILVSSDVINETVRTFFGNGKKMIQRPQWRFTYRNIGGIESGLYQLPIGALVVNVDLVGPAASAGLKAGDSITAVAGQNVGEDNSLEELLQQQKPGQAVGLTVVRDKKLMTITITPGL